MHCSSLGEFEQGRPVLERIRQQFPGHRILLTFFSPSGYEVQKDYAGADWVFYLPMDSPGNARRFLEIVHPSLVIFVKYEFWYYYLKKIKYRNIPLLLISAIFRKEMHFFRWYGVMLRKILSRFDHLFVQNEASKQLLDGIGMADICTVSGDTRYDRVIEIAATAGRIPLIETFVATQRVIVAGSTWAGDEAVLKASLPFLQANGIKLIIAPHVVDAAHLNELAAQFPGALFFSTFQEKSAETSSNVLIIDNVGMLSRLYQYSWCSYVGGGLSTTGVHNVLEAAVYGKPVLFGPNYEKYAEATGLLAKGAAWTFKEQEELTLILGKLLSAPELYQQVSAKAAAFVKGQEGATRRIMTYIQEKRLLTS